jgi:mannonate dehydratase
MTKGLTRRKAILGIAGMGLAGLAYRYWPEDGFSNPCPLDPLPKELLAHDLVQAAWQGIDPARFRDVHVHLIGTGDSGSGMWVNPDMQSLAHPIQWLQRAFYLNASCTPDNGRSDLAYVERLYWLLEQLPAGAKSLLLAFDWFHDERGRRVPEASAFHTPNAWAASLASKYPERFEWIASIHPYRRDAVELLRKWTRPLRCAIRSTRLRSNWTFPCWCTPARNWPFTVAIPRTSATRCGCAGRWSTAFE